MQIMQRLYNFSARSVAVAIDSIRGMTMDEAAAVGSTVRKGRNYATRQVTAPFTAQAIDQAVLGIVDSTRRCTKTYW